MQKVLISLPDSLASRMNAMIPNRQRSKVIARLIEDELKNREAELYRCALAVEKDEALNGEMKDWDVAVGDGLSDETW